MTNSKNKTRKTSDIYSPKKRSQIMSAIRGKNTSLEIEFQKMLKNEGLKFTTNVARLPGKPDIVFKRKKLAIFVDGCFWHGCKQHYKVPRSNQLFWENKIATNMKRDIHINKFYKNMGWKVIRAWEHQIKNDPCFIIKKIKSHVCQC